MGIEFVCYYLGNVIRRSREGYYFYLIDKDTEDITEFGPYSSLENALNTMDEIEKSDNNYVWDKD